MAAKRKITKTTTAIDEEKVNKRRLQNREAQKAFRARRAAEERAHSDATFSVHENASDRFMIELSYKRMETTVNEFAKILRESTDPTVRQYTKEQGPSIQAIVERLTLFYRDEREEPKKVASSPVGHNLNATQHSPTPARPRLLDEFPYHTTLEPPDVAYLEDLKDIYKKMNQIVPKSPQTPRSPQNRSPILDGGPMEAINRPD